MLRWIARAGTLVGIFFLMVFFTADHMGSMGLKEWTLFAFFPVTVLSGYILSWMYDRTGAAMSLAGIGLFYLLHWIMGSGFPKGTAFLFFAIPPVLFLLARKFSAKPA